MASDTKQWKNSYPEHLRIVIAKRKLRRNVELMVINYVLENQYGETETFDDYGEDTDRGPIEYRRLHVR